MAKKKTSKRVASVASKLFTEAGVLKDTGAKFGTFKIEEVTTLAGSVLSQVEAEEIEATEQAAAH